MKKRIITLITVLCVSLVTMVGVIGLTGCSGAWWEPNTNNAVFVFRGQVRIDVEYEVWIVGERSETNQNAGSLEMHIVHRAPLPAVLGEWTFFPGLGYELILFDLTGVMVIRTEYNADTSEFYFLYDLEMPGRGQRVVKLTTPAPSGFVHNPSADPMFSVALPSFAGPMAHMGGPTYIIMSSVADPTARFIYECEEYECEDSECDEVHTKPAHGTISFIASQHEAHHGAHGLTGVWRWLPPEEDDDYGAYEFQIATSEVAMNAPRPNVLANFKTTINPTTGLHQANIPFFFAFTSNYISVNMQQVRLMLSYDVNITVNDVAFYAPSRLLRHASSITNANLNALNTEIAEVFPGYVVDTLTVNGIPRANLSLPLVLTNDVNIAITLRRLPQIAIFVDGVEFEFGAFANGSDTITQANLNALMSQIQNTHHGYAISSFTLNGLIPDNFTLPLNLYEAELENVVIDVTLIALPQYDLLVTVNGTAFNFAPLANPVVRFTHANYQALRRAVLDANPGYIIENFTITTSVITSEGIKEIANVSLMDFPISIRIAEGEYITVTMPILIAADGVIAITLVPAPWVG